RSRHAGGRMNRGHRERQQPWHFVAPAYLLLAAVAGYPILSAVWLSLHRMILVFHERRFVALDNYAFLLHHARSWPAPGNTAYFAAVAVTLELLVGLAFALLLDAAVPGRGLLRASILVPWAIPTVVSAKLWAWLFNPDYGLVTHALGGGVDVLGT